MKYKIVRIELKDDRSVILYLKSVRKSGDIVPKADLSNPVNLIEFSMQMGMAVSKRLEEMMGFDAFITIDFERYAELDLKVGDVVEIEIRHLE